MTPRATVVVTTRNRHSLAPRAIASALAQTIDDVEVIVVDDGSSPPFRPETTDPRIRLVRRDAAGGPSAARNAGLARASGAWTTFLDDDDELAPEMLERCIEAARRSPLAPPVAAMSAVVNVSPEGAVLGFHAPGTLERGADWFLESRGGGGRASNSLVAPTAVLRAIGGWDEALHAFEHDDLGLRLNRVASVVGVDAPLYRMTTHDDSRLSADTSTIWRGMERTLAKHPAAFRRHRAVHARFMAALGAYALQDRRWGDAVRWCGRAVARDPVRPRLWKSLLAALGGPATRTIAVQRARLRRRGAAPVGPHGTNAAAAMVGRLRTYRELTRRRIHKYLPRVLGPPRLVVAQPLGALAFWWGARRHPRLGRPDARRVLLASVYRRANASVLVPAVTDAAARGWDVRLWALDANDPRLARYTLGVGPGARLPLLDFLVASPPGFDRYDWIVVTDDDVVAREGFLGPLLGVAEAAGLDLIQPAHAERSHRTYPFTVRRPLSLARRTTFVESGPLFAVRAPWTERVFPTGGDHEMGWGIELDWLDLAGEGMRLGIVDAVAVHHRGRVAAAYDSRGEGLRLRAGLERRGLRSMRHLQRDAAVWRPWQAGPPWQR